MKVFILLECVENAEAILRNAFNLLKGLGDVELRIFTAFNIKSAKGSRSGLKIMEMQEKAARVRRTALEVFAAIPFEFINSKLAPEKVVSVQANNWGCDLLIIGTHCSKGTNPLMKGGNAEKTIKRALCKVLVIPLRNNSAGS